MQPISGRIPDDLYDWLSSTSFSGATTMSDKLRVAISTLRRVHEGGESVFELAQLYREHGSAAKQALAQLEQNEGLHSEVLNVLHEHLPVMLAQIQATHVNNVDEAQALEQQAVKRTFTLSETLLRQAITKEAQAYDAQVVRNNMQNLLELVEAIRSIEKNG